MAATRVEITEDGKTITPARCCVVHAWISRDTFELLQRAADSRRIHIDQLVARLVEGTVQKVRAGSAID